MSLGFPKLILPVLLVIEFFKNKVSHFNTTGLCCFHLLDVRYANFILQPNKGQLLYTGGDGMVVAVIDHDGSSSQHVIHVIPNSVSPASLAKLNMIKRLAFS